MRIEAKKALEIEAENDSYRESERIKTLKRFAEGNVAELRMSLNPRDALGLLRNFFPKKTIDSLGSKQEVFEALVSELEVSNPQQFADIARGALSNTDFSANSNEFSLLAAILKKRIGWSI